jgi:hypothetical protein
MGHKNQNNGVILDPFPKIMSLSIRTILTFPYRREGKGSIIGDIILGGYYLE